MTANLWRLNNVPTFTHQGKELTAGQALDVWLAYLKDNNELGDDMDFHFFADACQGFSMPMAMLKSAGIEIQFGESK
jgi:hypothetical protein